MRKLELLAPAGDLNKLKTAIDFGADAVYVGGEEFSLRTACENFDEQKLREATQYAHSRGKKIYAAMNIFPKNNDLLGIAQYASVLEKINVDGIIAADIGTIDIIRKNTAVPIHVSTQANTTNYASANAWHKLGAKRIVLARELSLAEIAEIRQKLPVECEIEVFVHGAMCVSYSGRCLLSNYLANRDGNRGECAQPCRWKYSVVEEKRPGQFMPIDESESGTFIFNSKDLCMIQHIDKLAQAGCYSLKIEGRVKSEFYVATVVKAYRKAIDDYYERRDFDLECMTELEKISHRDYCTGFYFGINNSQIYRSGSYIRDYDLVGIVRENLADSIIVEQCNRFFVGDRLETLSPNQPTQEFVVQAMKNSDGEEIENCPHPQMLVQIPLSQNLPVGTFLRKDSTFLNLN